MAVNVVMPQMGESVAEGTVTSWLKKPGQSIKRDEPLLEISTDKVDTVVPSPSSGILGKILVEVGKTVAVGTVLATILPSRLEEKSKGRDGKPVKIVPKISTPREPKEHFSTSPHEIITFARSGKPSIIAPSVRSESISSRVEKQTRTKNFYSPAVLRAAIDLRLPLEKLSEIHGTGAGGRLTRDDVLNFATNDRHGAALSSNSFIQHATGTEPGFRPIVEPDDDLVEMSSTRKQIAEHMLRSKQVSAHATSFAEGDMSRVVSAREAHKEEFERREGFALTYMPFVAQAVVRALKDFPILNAAVDGDRIVMKRHVHLGIAVALESGLIVPVVLLAEEKDFIGLARDIYDLANRAREKRLKPEEVHGGTFTITNPGVFGGRWGTPILNQPQVGILGLGAIADRVVAIHSAIAIRPIMDLSLTIDHRIVDGAVSFQFLEKVKQYLENFIWP